MMKSLQIAFVLLISMMLCAAPTPAAACKNALQQTDPQVRFIQGVEKRLRRGDRKRACNLVLRKYTLNAAPWAGYVATWKTKAPLKKGTKRTRKRTNVRYDTSPGTALYAYCILNEPKALQKAQSVMGNATLTTWATGVLRQLNETLLPTDTERYAELLLQSGSKVEAKRLLAPLAKEKLLTSAHAWLTWAKIMETDDPKEAKKALSRCKRIAKRNTKVCRF